MSSVTAHRFQIERIIRRYTEPEMGVDAEFRLDGKWPLCSAEIRNGVPGIACHHFRMSLHQAAALQAALQMALDWIAEEQRTPTPPQTAMCGQCGTDVTRWDGRGWLCKCGQTRIWNRRELERTDDTASPRVPTETPELADSLQVPPEKESTE